LFEIAQNARPPLKIATSDFAEDEGMHEDPAFQQRFRELRITKIVPS
jgi:hypothetical protein